ncbi:hypothetical protein TcBrA4_0059790 [Trypanosoma cruzi]|nr:hypothetical protein TcBrA4_0059790 [Trypanosoma cruzi]
MLEVSTVSSPKSTANLRRKEVQLFYRAQERLKRRIAAVSVHELRLEAEKDHLHQLRRHGSSRAHQTKSPGLFQEKGKCKPAVTVTEENETSRESRAEARDEPQPHLASAPPRGK